jgi:hypothetical protein
MKIRPPARADFLHAGETDKHDEANTGFSQTEGTRQFVLCVSRERTATVAIYRVSQEEGTILRERVPYVKLYRKTPKHLYPKLNGLGDNGN